MKIRSSEADDRAKLGVHILVVIFGITSWSIMNGLWVELPILVSHLPEGWTLPSYLTIITQFGNVGLIVFTLIAYCKPEVKLETQASFLVAVALTLCALLYSFFWNHTAQVAGEYHSIALFILTVTQSIFAATTSIAYVTFMAHLKAKYMASIFIGMGFSGLIPAFAALGQGQGNVRCVHTRNTSRPIVNDNLQVTQEINAASLEGSYRNVTLSEVTDMTVIVNEEPQFSVQGFFLMLFAIGIVSVVCFLLLVFHPYCKTEHVDTDKEENCQLMQTSRPDNEKPLDKVATASVVHQVSLASSGVAYPEDTTPGTHDIITPEVHTLPGDEVVSLPTDFTSSPSAVTGTLQASDGLSLSIKDGHTRLEYITTNLAKMEDGQVPELRAVRSTQVDEVHKTDTGNNSSRQITKLESWYLLCLLVWINALQTSFVLAIQVYSSLPYGLRFYHGATKAENIVDPIASFLTFWITARTTPIISGLTLLGTLFTVYIIVVASMSPNPFLVHEVAGGALVVTAWVMCTMFMVFTKVSIASVMRGQGRLSLMWTGASTQLGTLIGAIVAYVTINALHLFKDEPWCR